MNLPDFSGRTAWVFGKGPSLEDYVVETILGGRLDLRAVHVGINQVPLVVDCDWAFATDTNMVVRMAGLWPVDCVPVLPGHLRTAYDAEDQKRVLWYEATNIRVGGWDEKDYIVGAWPHLRLVHWEGTALTALQFLRVCGCRDVVTVGMDGRGGYGRKWDNAAGSDKAFASILNAFNGYAKQWNIKVEKWEKSKQ